MDMLSKHGKRLFKKNFIPFYSTFQNYTTSKLLHKMTYREYSGDFLPYAQYNEKFKRYDYWTGYYTTRPLLK